MENNPIFEVIKLVIQSNIFSEKIDYVSKYDFWPARTVGYRLLGKQ